MSFPDLAVSFPTRGVILLSSRSLFFDPDSPTCRNFLERVLRAEEVDDVTIMGGDSSRAELRYCPKSWSLQRVAERVVCFLRQSPQSNGHAAASGHATINGRGIPHPGKSSHPAVSVTRTRDGVVRVARPRPPHRAGR